MLDEPVMVSGIFKVSAYEVSILALIDESSMLTSHLSAAQPQVNSQPKNFESVESSARSIVLI